MIRAEEVAAIHAADRPGFRLVDYDEIALPFYWLTLEALIQEKKALTATEEFVLSGIANGLKRPESVARFLGLDSGTVERVLVDLLRVECIDYLPESGERALALTERGGRVLEALARVMPRQQDIWVGFDRITWDAVPRRKGDFIAGRDLRDRRFREIRPRRARRPELSEVSVASVRQALSELGFIRAERRDRAGADILSIRNVRRADRIYLPGVLLIYMSDEGHVQYGVAIDGRLSDSHSNYVSDQLQANRQGLRLAAYPAEGIDPMVARLAPVPSTTRQAADKVSAVQRKLHDGGQAVDRDALRRELREAQRALDDMPVRPLAVFEHPPMLTRALDRTTSRLLIISPWIRAAIVDDDFLSKLARLLATGTVVHIGYGMPTKGQPEVDVDIDEAPWTRLSELARNNSTFVFRRLATHAKILISDSLLITTSFNWLSYRGDPNRTFRQEEGLLVKDPSVVDERYRYFRAEVEAGSLPSLRGATRRGRRPHEGG